MMHTSVRTRLALASLGASVVGAALGGPASPAGAAEMVTPEEVLRSAAITRGLDPSDAEISALAEQLGSVDAARSFVSTTAGGEVTTTMTSTSPPSAVMAAAGNCTSRHDRYSMSALGVEFLHHSLRTTWCWDQHGDVTSVSGYRVGYGTTFAGQLQGYRWTADPSVQEQRVYVAHSHTDKYGTHNFVKGSARQTGHWAECLSGPLDWACPVERDAHTVVDVGYGNASSSRSYNA